MSPRLLRAASLVLGLAVAAVCAPLRAQEAVTVSGSVPESVRVPSLDTDLGVAEGTALSGFYFRPASPGPWPLVIGLHGCSGLVNTAGAPFPLYRSWAERLVAQNYAVLLIDSFTPRGFKEVCTIPFGSRTVRPGVERVRDVWGAVRWAQARQGEIRSDRIALIGWSHGGSTVLYSVWPGSSGWRLAPGIKPVAAIAFYPGCKSPFEEGRGWYAGLPLTILIGEDDDWTPARWCQDLAAREETAERPFNLITYPGAVHAFDAPEGRVRQRTGLHTPSGTAWIGPHEAARADAIRRVEALLARVFRSGK